MPTTVRGFDAARADGPLGRRFLQLAEVAEVLDISVSQVYALVRRGELRAIKIGGRGQWRVERAALEQFVTDCYTATDAFVAGHPFGLDEDLQDSSLPDATR